MNSEYIYNEDQTKQIKTKVCFQNINNDSFFEKVFAYMKKNKSLNIMKFNQKLQKRLNLSIKDYKEYSQLYTPIEIELKMADNRYVKFINIPPKEKEYYHIYFDNSTEEINRNDLNPKDKVNIIKIKIDHQVISFGGLFSECEYIRSINFKKFYRTNIINMGSMFSKCFGLEELNL